jgi:ribosomal subunit interface protein
MQISVSGKNIDVGESLREYVSAELERLVSRYFERAIDGTATITRQAGEFRCEIYAHVGRGLTLTTGGSGDTAHRAVDAAFEHLAKRLRRQKRRLKDYWSGRMHASEPGRETVLSEVETETAVEEDGATAEPVTIAETQTAIDTLTVSQAVMRLDLDDRPAILFRNAAHGGINLVYRRRDGNIGWIEPENQPTAKPGRPG